MVSMAIIATLLLVLAGVLPTMQARLLTGRWDTLQGWDAATYTSIEGQQPSGLFSSGENAEAQTAASTKGIRYNGGRSVSAGDVYPAQRSSGTTGSTRVSSGNAGGEANVNLGLEVVASTTQGARAAAGSGVLHTAETSGSISNNVATFRPGTTRSRGSVSFTDVTPTSASVTGVGNGPVAMAWGQEVGAMARSQKTVTLRNHGEMWAGAQAPSTSRVGAVTAKNSLGSNRFQKLTTCLSC